MPESIKSLPENYSDMISKLAESEQRTLDAMKKKRKVTDNTELVAAARTAIDARNTRTSRHTVSAETQQPVDRTIKRDPDSPEVKALRDALAQEDRKTAAVFRSHPPVPRISL